MHATVLGHQLQTIHFHDLDDQIRVVNGSHLDGYAGCEDGEVDSGVTRKYRQVK